MRKPPNKAIELRKKKWMCCRERQTKTENEVQRKLLPFVFLYCKPYRDRIETETENINSFLRPLWARCLYFFRWRARSSPRAIGCLALL